MIDYDTGKYFMIRGAGNEIWDLLTDREMSFSEIVDALLAEYEVSREECETSVRQFLSEMERYEFI
uniref:PqqD family protein n=1 Tax=Eubacterium cellulosolvens TaxID=29322 RepID=UPI000ADB7D67|nr:PqqD family protein [[Eubacterium] cellulosolvens]